eukprot:jgi/Galph1/1903/GphlegSOOS_G585.1
MSSLESVIENLSDNYESKDEVNNNQITESNSETHQNVFQDTKTLQYNAMATAWDVSSLAITME